MPETACSTSPLPRRPGPRRWPVWRARGRGPSRCSDRSPCRSADRHRPGQGHPCPGSARGSHPLGARRPSRTRHPVDQLDPHRRLAGRRAPRTRPRRRCRPRRRGSRNRSEPGPQRRPHGGTPQDSAPTAGSTDPHLGGQSRRRPPADGPGAGPDGSSGRAGSSALRGVHIRASRPRRVAQPPAGAPWTVLIPLSTRCRTPRSPGCSHVRPSRRGPGSRRTRPRAPGVARPGARPPASRHAPPPGRTSRTR